MHQKKPNQGWEGGREGKPIFPPSSAVAAQRLFEGEEKKKTVQRTQSTGRHEAEGGMVWVVWAPNVRPGLSFALLCLGRLSRAKTKRVSYPYHDSMKIA